MRSGPQPPASRVEASGSPESDRHGKWWVLSALAFGTFMGTLDGSITNIALPTIAADFHLPSVADASWVTLAYLLASGSLFLLFGRLGEMIGGKRVYHTGLGVFTVGSLLCSLSPSFLILIGLRVVQAIGAAMIVAVGPAILTSTFPARQRGQALGLNSAVVSAGLATGPTIGGFLVQSLTWRSIFWINLPIGLIGLVWAWYILPEQPRRPVRSFDVPGTALLATGLLAVLLATTEGQSWGWVSAVTLGTFGLGFVLLALFIVRELATDQPLLELGLFRERPFSAGNLSTLLSFLSLASVSFLMPYYLEQGQGRTSETSGLLLTALPLGIAVAAPISGALSDRFDARLFGAAGMGLVAVGDFLLARLGVAAGISGILVALALSGIGNGMFQSPNNSLIMSSVRREKLGTAAGMIASMRTLGQVVGIAIAGAVVASRDSLHAAQLSAQRVTGQQLPRLALTASIHDAFHVAMISAVVAILTSLVRGKVGGQRDRAAAAPHVSVAAN